MKVCFIVKDAVTKKPIQGADVILYSTYLGKTDSRGMICGDVNPTPMVTNVRYTVIKQGYKPVNAGAVLPGIVPIGPKPPDTVPLPVLLEPVYAPPTTPTPQQPTYPSSGGSPMPEWCQDHPELCSTAPSTPTTPTPQPTPTTPTPTPTPTTPTPQQPTPTTPTPQPQPQPVWSWNTILEGILSFASRHAVEISLASAGLVATALAVKYLSKR